MNDLFRPDALHHHTLRKREGTLLQAAPAWTERGFWLLVAGTILFLAFACVHRVEREIQGVGVALSSPARVEAYFGPEFGDDLDEAGTLEFHPGDGGRRIGPLPIVRIERRPVALGANQAKETSSEHIPTMLVVEASIPADVLARTDIADPVETLQGSVTITLPGRRLVSLLLPRIPRSDAGSAS